MSKCFGLKSGLINMSFHGTSSVSSHSSSDTLFHENLWCGTVSRRTKSTEIGSRTIKAKLLRANDFESWSSSSKVWICWGGGRIESSGLINLLPGLDRPRKLNFKSVDSLSNILFLSSSQSNFKSPLLVESFSFWCFHTGLNRSSCSLEIRGNVELVELGGTTYALAWILYCSPVGANHQQIEEGVPGWWSVEDRWMIWSILGLLRSVQIRSESLEPSSMEFELGSSGLLRSLTKPRWTTVLDSGWYWYSIFWPSIDLIDLEIVLKQ